MLNQGTSLQAWAVARSIFKGCVALPWRRSDKFPSIEPHNCELKFLSFGPMQDVVFSEENILNLHKGIFALPEFRFWIKHPFSAFQKIKTLQKFGSYLKTREENLEYLIVLLATCLEATTVYMNHHAQCIKLLENEKGPVCFFLKDINAPLITLTKNGNAYWDTTFETPEIEPRVKLSFDSINTGILSCLGRINPLVGSALGNYQVDGYLPLMDKVGYCSRLTAKDLPLLI
jgi:hypothetical protein